MEEITNEIKDFGKQFQIFTKWCVFAILTGVITGFVGVGFVYAVNFVTDYRIAHSWTIFLLPVVGVLIVLMYRACGKEHDKGTNMVITAIRTDEPITLSTAPLIFISTILTHFAGGSSGREGAALQFGGSLGEALGSLFKFQAKDKKIIIMCGMSGAFSAVFGTPLAAVIFPLEVISVGIMQYSALVPCMFSSLAAHFIAVICGIEVEKFVFSNVPEFHLVNALIIAGLSILFAVVSILFCEMLHKAHHYIRLFILNKILRIIFSGSIIILLTLIFGRAYNGIGMDVISRAVMQGETDSAAFLLKMIFTAVTLSTGFKGGEIVPSFFVGATFGCLCGNLIGFSPSLCAAAGMVGVFCGVTNSPMTSLFIALELFGAGGMLYYLITVTITYMLSGYFSLYKSQKIVYSKTEPTYIDKTSGES